MIAETGDSARAAVATDYTVGVEEEFQLVDAETGELRSRARAVLAADRTGSLKPEMQQNTVEVQTRICTSTVQIREELSTLRLRAAVAADAPDTRVVAAGTHPFSQGDHEFTRSPTYDRLRADYRRLAETQHIFGQHIHVSVPEGVDRVVTMNVVRAYSAVLLALSASSPLLHGTDTGYASYRWVLWRRWPRTGPPPRMENRAAFERLVSALIGTGCMDAAGRLYWELRPHHLYPTLEFRVADVTPRLDDAIALAALARAVVAGAVEGILQEPEVEETVLHTLLVENSWRAARYGTRAELVDVSEGEIRERSVAEVVRRLMDRLGPLSERLGDGEALASLQGLLERGDAAGRIRARWAGPASGSEVVRWLADETLLGVGLDRRTEQRADG